MKDNMATQDIISDPTLSSIRQVAGMLAEAHVRAEERAKATHERFNVFTMLHKGSDEVRLHTRFLHGLLDPKGFHDCGPLFLQLFFSTLNECLGLNGTGIQAGPAWPVADEEWRVRKETGRSEGHGQMDLLLDHPRRFGIAIENKIHAREQDGQLAGYATYLAKVYGANSKLIYLTLDGKESGTHLDNAYVPISYAEHILPWLDLCLEKTYHVIPVNQVILQYRSLVRTLTGKTMETETLKRITRIIAEHPDVVRYRNQISEAIDEAETQFMEQLGEAIILQLKDDYQIRMEPANGRFGSGNGEILVIRDANGEALVEEPFKFCLEYGDEFGELSIGIFVTYDPEQQQLSAEQKLFVNRMKVANARFNPAENEPSDAWPLGWVSLLEGLDDNGFADRMKNGIPAILDGICDTIREYAQDFSHASLKVKTV